jgi:hypothetical protein
MTITGGGALDSEVAQWRAGLGARRFSDDGRTLRGHLEWTGPAGSATALIELEPDQSFPFAPPVVRVLDAGADVELTFHLNRPTDADVLGGLCLWEDAFPVEDAPWLEVDTLLDRIGDWLTRTANGWPDDDVCDLERYLPPNPKMVLYDSETLKDLQDECVWVRDKTKPVVTVTTDRRLLRRSRGRRVPAHQDRKLCWIGDLGDVRRPIRSWPDLRAALGADGPEIDRLIRSGIVRFLLLQYRRGSNAAVLALVIQPVPGTTRLEVTAAEAADTSQTSRTLRGSAVHPAVGERSVAIVGVGAIGSHLADLLFRSGVRKLTLIDHERLRPGNLIRHLADDRSIGRYKVHAVREHLTLRGLDASGIRTSTRRVDTSGDATRLLQTHDLVIDATASARTTSLLTWHAQATGAALVTVCLQRQGALARVDRYPLRAGETPLSAPPADPNAPILREPGCDQAISPTPPAAVLCAAELATRAVLDQLQDVPALPCTLIEVRDPQADHPYTRVGLLTAETPHAA